MELISPLIIMNNTSSLYVNFLRLNGRRYLILAGLSIALLASLWLDLIAGPAGLSAGQILSGLLDPETLELRYRIILWDVRLPDALIALAVGGALGLSGIETQTVLDNPLASPFTLGISSAAVLGASFAIIVEPVIPFVPSYAILPTLALCGALASSAIVLVVVRVSKGSRGMVVLFGIAMFFLCDALASGFHLIADADAAQQIVFWAIGNLTKAGWLEVTIVSLCLLLIFPFSMRQVWVLTLLRGGEDHARSTGVNIAGLRTWVIVRASILAAFAVCFVGTIGFVGLVGPHIARMLLGEDHRTLLPGSILCGALILSLASALSKTLIPGVIVPVGILTAVVGVPMFLSLLFKKKGQF
ncbi:FecCD family ABC transporter permease [Curvivirga aplysinae]|uniref:FecCD family ABC transporter permease n=1 Tax=Curvivirga aplysinae TaxID=2529852 RepID=UPI001F39CBE1|nr:iron ABC transporter permease [Curvivirga aplysinae]